MEEKIFLTVQSDYHKTQIPVDDIIYITIEGRKTKITRSDGSALSTNKSLRDVFAQLPEDQFSNINRGIVVSKRHIKSEVNGIVTMGDGATFRRRVRSDRAPRREKAKKPAETRKPCPVEALSAWLHDSPMAFCVLELVYKQRGGGAVFEVRYCNRAMEVLEGIDLMTTEDPALSRLPGLGNPKWLPIFADVAINGGCRVVEDVWNDRKFLRLSCYQPQSGYCALTITDLTRENSLIQELFQRGK